MSDTKFKKRGSTSLLVAMLIILVGLVAAILFWPSEAVAATPKAQVEQDDLAATTLIHAGDMAPDFTVTMLNGDKVTLSELRGKVVLLTFWATWCPPCRQELSHMQALIDANPDIVVLPISRGETRATVEGFMHKMKYKFAVGLDPKQEIYAKYATNYIPRCFVIDRNGKVVYSGVGYDEQVDQEMKAAIAAAK